MENRPGAREKRVTGGGKGVSVSGSGTGMGQVGSGAAMGRGDAGGPKREGGSGGKMGFIIALIVLLLGGSGAGIGSMLGGGDGAAYDGSAYDAGQDTQAQSVAQQSVQESSQGSQTAGGSYGSLAGLFGNVSQTSEGWTGEANTRQLDTSVDPSARERYTKIRGNGEDAVTVMVYMCGTDLESRSGMATNDLNEMTKASLSEKVNVIVYPSIGKLRELLSLELA